MGFITVIIETNHAVYCLTRINIPRAVRACFLTEATPNTSFLVVYGHAVFMFMHGLGCDRTDLYAWSIRAVITENGNCCKSYIRKCPFSLMEKIRPVKT